MTDKTRGTLGFISAIIGVIALCSIVSIVKQRTRTQRRRYIPHARR